MPHGLITPTMENALKAFVRGRDVWDLGAGDLTYSKLLKRLGAKSVTSVEKELHVSVSPDIIPTYFKDVPTPPEGIDVAFLSWPVNWHVEGLERLLNASRNIVYLGCNFDGSACGSQSLWRLLTRRAILGTEPHHRNTMIFYGGVGHERALLREEQAGLTGELMGWGI